MTLQMRPALDTDLATVRRIHHAGIRDICARDYPAETIAAWLAGTSEARYLQRIRTQSFWIAEEDGLPVAFGSVDLAASRLESLFVLPQALGRGIAQGLLMHLEQIALDAGVQVLQLDASLSAQSFYARQGYRASSPAAPIRMASRLELIGIPMHKSLHPADVKDDPA